MIRTLATLVGLAAVIGAATLAAPSSDGGTPAAATTLEVPPVRQPVACPGPLEIPVGSILSGDEELDSGSADVEYQVLPAGEPVGAGEAIDESQAVAVERVATGDIAGLAGLGCAAPSRDLWLVGGATTLGSSARLVLTNPTDAAVRAHLEFHGPVGPANETPSVLVAARSQETVLLESIAPDLPAIAVHVTAEGVGIAAALQDSRLDGFTAAGTDWVVPAPVSDQLLVPVAGPSTEEAPATLSLLAPEGATALLHLVTADGPQPWLGDEPVTLEPGVLTDVQIPAVGAAGVRIDATAPVVAGVRTVVQRDSAVEGRVAADHAWTSAQPAADGSARAAVVPDGDVTLVALSAVAAVATIDAEGGAIELDLSADAVAIEPLDLAPGTVLTSTSPVAWALLVTDADAGFVTTVEPVVTDVTAATLTVDVGGYSAP